jgi:putative membrane protein
MPESQKMEANRVPPPSGFAATQPDRGAYSGAGPLAVGRWWQRGVRNGALIAAVVLAAAVLLNGSDISATAAAMRDLPAAIAISAAVHLPQVLMTALAWRTLVPDSLRPSATAMGVLRWYRESAGTLLPIGGLVGQVAAARLLARSGVPGPLAGATATVDLTVEVVAQVFFTLAGLVLLLGRGGSGGIAGVAAVGIAVVAGCALALVGVQLLPRLRWVGTRLAPLAPKWPALQLQRLHSVNQALLCLHAQPRTLAAALCWHSGAWAFGALEIVGVLALLGRPVSLADGLIIESMAQALRNAGFMLPGAVGVQEAALIGAAALVGISPAEALTVALVRRAREVLTSIAGLLAWQRAEGGWRATAVPAPTVIGNEGGQAR